MALITSGQGGSISEQVDAFQLAKLNDKKLIGFQKLVMQQNKVSFRLLIFGLFYVS